MLVYAAQIELKLMSLLQQKCLTTNDVMHRYRSQLETVQGYSVVGHGRDYVRVGLLTCRRLSNTEKAKARATIASLASKLTNACELYQSYEAYKALKSANREEARQRITPEVVKAFGLSSAGYTALGIRDCPAGPSYQTGPAGRYPDSVPSLTNGARFGAIVVLAGNKKSAIDTEQARWDHSLRRLGDLTWDHGSLLKKNDGQLRDHFGFKEGISQPVLFQRDMPPAESMTAWDPSVALSAVLCPQPGAPPNSQYGSFMAYLKIEQDPYALDCVVERMMQATGATAPEVRSWILGRFDDGRPVIPGTPALDNDFVYPAAPSANRCPAAAHIRKMNPRTNLSRANRVVRRGAFYENGGAAVPTADADPSEQNSGVGILFQCFQSKLETGFETLFGDWALEKDHPEDKCGLDPLLGSRDCPPRPADVAMDQSVPVPFEIQSFTTIIRGEYFFFPAIPFLQNCPEVSHVP